MKTALTASFILLAFGTVPLRAAPVLIDNFGTDQPPITSHDQLDGSMLGGEADFYFAPGLSAFWSIEEGSGKLSGITNGGSFDITYDGEDNESTGGSFALPVIDLTDGGANDRFAIDMPAVEGLIGIAVRIYDGPSNITSYAITVSSAGIHEFLFSDFEVQNGAGADFDAANMVRIVFYNVGPGDDFEIDSIMTRDAALPPEDDPVPAVSTPDTARPAIQFLKKEILKKPRLRHRIKGLALDNDEVARVEVRVKRKGWRRAKLRASGRWQFRTPRLETGKNRFKARARDASGNRSKAKKVVATGK